MNASTIPQHTPLRLVIAVAAMFVAAWPAVGFGEIGDVVYRTNFDDAATHAAFSMRGEGVRFIRDANAGEDAAGTVLFVHQPADVGPGTRGATLPLPVQRLRGNRVLVECRGKAENVSRPPNSWNGIECMLHYKSPSGQQWMQENNVHGTFDWKPIRFTAEIPQDATEASLTLGLELVSGKVWLDDVTITVVGRRRSRPEVPADPPRIDHPRFRGAMIGTRVDEDDLRVLGGEWKANHVRWQLLWGGFPHGPADTASVAEYREWLDGELDRIDRCLPICRELGIKVLIDVHTPPGGRDQRKVHRIFTDAEFQRAFVDNWERIARRYKDEDAVWGYDLVNEPVEGPIQAGLLDWHALATKTAKKIREIDPRHAIIVEPGPWGSPEGLDWFEPLDVPGVVYSVHMYKPHQFTHQGVYDAPTGISYPGMIDGVHWDRDALREALRPAIEYQRDFGVEIYIGEFSAIRWAPGESAENYLRDCIAIFEEQGWSWAYHAFREWDGWSVEHGPDRSDRSPSKTPTGRERLLRSWFEKCREDEARAEPSS